MVAEMNKPALTVKDYGSSLKKITVQELNDLGYELSGKQRPMGSRPVRFCLLEVKHENSKQLASFSFLYSLDDQVGVVLPQTFKFYLEHLK